MRLDPCFRTLCRGTAFLIAGVVLGGCYTHQFFGMVSVPEDVRCNETCRFRVDEVTFEDQMGLPTEEQSTVFPYLTESQAQIVEASNRLCAQSGDARSEESVRLHVVLTKFRHEMDTARTILYFCSLGTLPSLMTTDGEATVHVQKLSGEEVGSYSVQYHQWAAVTCYTPFALLCGRKSDSSARVNEFTQTALFIKTTGKYGMMEQCAKAFGDTVATGLSDYLKKARQNRRTDDPSVLPAPLAPVLLLTNPTP